MQRYAGLARSAAAAGSSRSCLSGITGGSGRRWHGSRSAYDCPMTRSSASRSCIDADRKGALTDPDHKARGFLTCTVDIKALGDSDRRARNTRLRGQPARRPRRQSRGPAGGPGEGVAPAQVLLA
jgi:hypothetical protein